MAQTIITERHLQNGIQNGRRLRSAALLSAFRWMGAQFSKMAKRADFAPKKNSVSA